VWEYLTSGGTWAALDSVEDETRGLSLTGFVRFRAPGDHVASSILPHLWTVRCRVFSGRYECPPIVARIAVNAVSAAHAVLTPARRIGVSQGHASESFVLEHTPVVAESVQLHVVQGGIEDPGWQEVAQWDRVGPHERTFRLEPERAQISFGDGRVGRVPPAGATLVCAYRVGGGAEGNIAAGTLVDVSAPVTLRQPFAAFGGAAAETLDDARGRALAYLAEPVRAITLSDFESVALSTPGVPVARARALAGHHPELPCVPAAGVVTVVAVPSCPAERPEPGADFLNAVHRWLAPRCALTTELHVVGPSYRVVGVHARLHAEPGVEPNALAATAAAALDRFFHPLEGGPDGTGWPVGRAVYRSEVLALLNTIDGVAFVDRLGLVPEGETDASCANVPLCPAELAAAGEHRLQVIARRPMR
jgi:predicted phage baseplate assembly protein